MAGVLPSTELWGSTLEQTGGMGSKFALPDSLQKQLDWNKEIFTSPFALPDNPFDLTKTPGNPIGEGCSEKKTEEECKENLKSKIKSQLKVHEGRRNDVYLDTAKPRRRTVGIGHNLEADPAPEILGKKELKEKTGNTKADMITDKQIDALFKKDVDKHLAELLTLIPAAELCKLSENRQLVMLDMAFNMGIGTDGLGGFRNTLAALAKGDFEAVAKGMGNSLWFKQVGNRSKRLVYMMRNDVSFEDALKKYPP